MVVLKKVLLILLGLIVFGSTFGSTVYFLSKNSLEREIFEKGEGLVGYSVFCESDNQLALETYCRFIRAGAIPVHSVENADIYIYVEKSILYVGDHDKKEAFLNIPLGEQYSMENDFNYVSHIQKFIAEYPPTHSKVPIPVTTR